MLVPILRSLAPVSRLDRQVLRDVSRSFYLSIRLLPGPMRPAIATAYLLARASDTLADTAAVPVDDRLDLLDDFASQLAGRNASRAGWDQKIEPFLRQQTHPGERVLLERLGECLADLEAFDGLQGDAVRETLAIIISGQRLDLVRFEEASASKPVALKNEEQLEDYCYRVAGCVGEFWTRIGLLTMGSRFSDSFPDDLRDLGVRYGMGLQLVNILRDLPRDLADGRCYLPVADPTSVEAVATARAEWLGHAAVWLEAGRRYASRLNGRRLRSATVLPALIGDDTVEMLRSDPAGTARVKVTRDQVKSAIWRSLWWPRAASPR